MSEVRETVDAAKARLEKAERAYGAAKSELLLARDQHDRLLHKWFHENYGQPRKASEASHD